MVEQWSRVQEPLGSKPSQSGRTLWKGFNPHCRILRGGLKSVNPIDYLLAGTLKLSRQSGKTIQQMQPRKTKPNKN